MAKRNPSSATRRSRRFQKPLNTEELVDVESSIDSYFLKIDNDSSASFENHPISQKKARKRPMEQTPKKVACKKGKVERSEFGPEDKLIFYGPNEKERFESYKSKSMAYGCSVSLSLMQSLNCDVTAIFDFQHLSPLFDTLGNSVYEEPVRMFYTNLFVNDKDDLESMVLGTRIVLDSYHFEKIFSAKFSGICLRVSGIFPFLMLVCPNGILISHILEVMKEDLAPFTPKHISSTYDKTAFSMMGYSLGESGWVKRAKVESAPAPVDVQADQPVSQSTTSLNLQQIQQHLDGVKLLFVEMKEQVDKIRDVTKETGSVVAKLRIDIGAIKRHGTRAFNSMTKKMDKLVRDVENSYDSF
ncbi:hypothetical protein A4A49_20645 [Nicotiana attenuata]|uniref:Uncharacterized protein n=1 Tax=Nicotiana attenuata TaxID=49451 RepID=A0A1J6ITG4_NICAT|nr:hypothetical protein A4A49_20645 [Nicotiana attenuata]